MYFLVLAAILQLSEHPPKMVAKFDTPEACFAAAKEANQHPQINDEQGRGMGLRFLCMTFIPEGKQA